MRFTDGSAGDADYATIGAGYTRYRQPEPLIYERIEKALGDARTVLNVGAGAGSYEPLDREVGLHSHARRSRQPGVKLPSFTVLMF